MQVDDDASSVSAAKSDSAQMLGDAGDALNKLLKSSDSAFADTLESYFWQYCICFPPYDTAF